MKNKKIISSALLFGLCSNLLLANDNPLPPPSIVSKKKEFKKIESLPQRPRELPSTIPPMANIPGVASSKKTISPQPESGENPRFEDIMKLLKSTKGFSEADIELKKKAQEAEAAKIATERRKKLKEAMNNMLLPIPKSSITIGDKVLVFATYREKIAKTADSSRAVQVKDSSPELIGLESMRIVFEEKTIELKEGDRFGSWIVSIVDPFFVEYNNINDSSKTVRKYY